MYEVAPQVQIGSALFTVLLGIYSQPFVGSALAYGWLAGKLLILALRWQDWRAYCRASVNDRLANEPRWRLRQGLMSCLDGLGWGAGGVMLFARTGGVLDGLLVATLVGVAAVGMLALLYRSPDAIRFAAGCLAPMVWHYWQSQSPASGMVAAACAIYLLALSLEARRAERQLLELLQLRFEHASIVELHQQALLEAESSNATKSRFLATVSHELRTPLNGIIGMAELLGHEDINSAQKARVAVIRRSAQHLLGLIGEVLDVSRVEFGRLNLVQKPIQLPELLQEVQALLRPSADDRGLSFLLRIEPSLPATAELDAVRVKQVLHNLIGNALKFTARGGVLVTASRLDAQLQFKIVDSGQGIPADEQERIFDAFEQGQGSPDTRRSGTGLGLTISRQLARAMGGNVVCQSSPGAGSTFTFTLPYVPVAQSSAAQLGAATLAEDRAEPVSPSAAPLSPLEGLRVLVVEDNPVNALVAEGLLCQLGAQVQSVSDGALALERLASSPVDLVLMDCQMPVMDGWEAARRWRAIEESQNKAHPPGRRLPIIALTANALSGDRERCLAAGMDDYLPKPFQRDELITLLQRYRP